MTPKRLSAEALADAEKFGCRGSLCYCDQLLGHIAAQDAEIAQLRSLIAGLTKESIKLRDELTRAGMPLP